MSSSIQVEDNRDLMRLNCIHAFERHMRDVALLQRALVTRGIKDTDVAVVIEPMGVPGSAIPKHRLQALHDSIKPEDRKLHTHLVGVVDRESLCAYVTGYNHETGIKMQSMRGLTVIVFDGNVVELFTAR